MRKLLILSLISLILSLIVLFTPTCYSYPYYYKARLQNDETIVVIHTVSDEFKGGDVVWISPDSDGQAWHLDKPDSAYKATILGDDPDAIY